MQQYVKKHSDGPFLRPSPILISPRKHKNDRLEPERYISQTAISRVGGHTVDGIVELMKHKYQQSFDHLKNLHDVLIGNVYMQNYFYLFDCP